MTTPTSGALLHVEEVMGTVVTLDVRDTALPARDLDRAVRAAVAILHDADRTFSTWDPDSALLRARRGQPVTGREQAELDIVARACRSARARTGGWFDPWAMPGGYDPTGLVKGWAALRALAALTAAGVRHAAVNAGGDLSVVGDAHTAPGADRGWRVGIVDPHRPTALLGSVVARDSAVATSAGYERGSLAVDPSTAKVVERLASATVLAADLVLADACAGAACAQGPAALAWLDRLPGVQAMLVTLDGRQLTTSAWAEATRWVPAAAPGHDPNPVPRPGQPATAAG